jgi:hypothetical protein
MPTSKNSQKIFFITEFPILPSSRFFPQIFLAQKKEFRLSTTAFLHRVGI